MNLPKNNKHGVSKRIQDNYLERLVIKRVPLKLGKHPISFDNIPDRMAFLKLTNSVSINRFLAEGAGLRNKH